MSSILLNNPLVTPVPSSSLAQDAAPALAVTPATTVTPTRDSGGSTSFSNSGSGTGDSRQGDNVALLTKSRRNAMARPPDATGRSVVNAQGQEAQEELFVYGNNLPEVEMPDPLPTSPFLKKD